MRFVVKLGGAGLVDDALLAGSVRAIAAMGSAGHQVAVVHGGGVQLTRALEAMGHRSEFRDGLRVTDAKTRDVALMVFAGEVNKRLVAALAGVGQAAVGMCRGDGMQFRARRKRMEPDLGFVGEIASSDPRWMEAIWGLRGVPVLAPVALGFDGEYYNVNADEMAAACARSVKADALVYLTDVPGVRGADGEVLRWLSIDQIAEMTRTAVISGGMLPKLGACREALLHGVKRVRILPAAAAARLPELCSARIEEGTEVMVA